MVEYLGGLAAIFIAQFFRAVTIIIIVVVTENLREIDQIKNVINSNTQKS